MVATLPFDGQAEVPSELANFLESERDPEAKHRWKPAQLAHRNILWGERDRIPGLAAQDVVPCECLRVNVNAQRGSDRLRMLTFGIKISFPSL